MDSRIYFHQYRRPRVSNPTYLSTNIQNSMTFFNSNYAPQSHHRENISNYPINRYTPSNNQIPAQASPYHTEIPNNHRYQQVQQSIQPIENLRQPVSSRLSNYGERSLMMDQRGIHDKQTSKFDIINLKPRQHSQDIKQYPWLTVENRDDIYYKRMNEMYNGSNERAKTNDKSIGNVAGKHTYDLQPKISVDPQKNPKHFTAKMLNHMDELHHNLG